MPIPRLTRAAADPEGTSPPPGQIIPFTARIIRDSSLLLIFTAKKYKLFVVIEGPATIMISGGYTTTSDIADKRILRISSIS